MKKKTFSPPEYEYPDLKEKLSFYERAQGSTFKPAHTRELETWRSSYENKWRILSASTDCTMIMWDILGTNIRVDRVRQLVDDEVDRMPIAELAV